ncbi:MAG TPA: HAMP domain-containing methyl-accepting chemotaxis protein [Candidatus Dormibacteraeota bacterium]|nr:HAMP domain-containing methyl-accepting chemotaxis protein [Candidatus Dormibacteraeota bacterium]
MELKKPVSAARATSQSGLTKLHVMTIAPLEPDRSRSDVAGQKIWDSFFVRMMASLLAVALPFFIIAGLLPNLLAGWGVAAKVLATVLLIGITGVAARLTIRPIVALSRAAARAEAGDLSVRVIPGGSSEMRQLGHAFNAMLDRLAGTRFGLRSEVSESAARLAATAEQLAAATREQTTAASDTSASMEELSRTTVSIAETAAGVATQAGEVRGRIQSAQSELSEAGDRVLALTRTVGEIEGILVLIDDIADQTNLLALNAAIEAARAGESGRGFAVVADEVRRLAERSKAASAQIAKLVEAAQAQSQATVMSVERRGGQMNLWLAMMVTMADASGQVQAATQLQRSAVEHAVDAIEHIAVSSRSVAATAQEIALAASGQDALAAGLSDSREPDRGA